MGIMSLNFLSKDKNGDETVLSSPDTEFGSGPDGAALALAGIPSAAGGAATAEAPGSANAAMLRLGQLIRPGASSTDDEEESNLSLPLIGHLSLPRQLRILLVAFGGGILLTILAMWQTPT